jgi:hypothetical protein
MNKRIFLSLIFFLNSIYMADKNSYEALKVKKGPFKIEKKIIRIENILKYLKCDSLKEREYYIKLIEMLKKKNKLKKNKNGSLSLDEETIKACKIKYLNNIQNAVIKYNFN